MSRITKDTDPATIPPNTPLRLSLAAEIAFPGGGMTASSLRREAAKGHLVIERYAGKDFVTLAAIEAMRELCLAKQKERVPAPSLPRPALSGTKGGPDSLG